MYWCCCLLRLFLSNQYRLINLWSDPTVFLSINPVTFNTVWRIGDRSFSCFSRIKGNLDPAVSTTILCCEYFLSFGQRTPRPRTTVDIGKPSVRSFTLIVFADESARDLLVEVYRCIFFARSKPIEKDLSRLFAKGREVYV